MRKNELITKLSKKLSVAKEEVISKKQVLEYLETIDTIVDIVAEGEVNDKVKLGKGITLEKVFIEGRSGVCNGNAYVVEPHYEIKVKRTPAMKSI